MYSIERTQHDESNKKRAESVEYEKKVKKSLKLATPPCVCAVAAVVVVEWTSKKATP